MATCTNDGYDGYRLWPARRGITTDSATTDLTTNEQQVVAPATNSIDADEDTYDAKGVAVASFAHFSHDLYPSFIGPLVPAIQDKLGVSLAMASLMVPAQQMPSILQPFIGAVADRTSRRWFVVLSPAMAAISLSSLGLAPNIAVVLMLLLVSGLASAMFHAPAVALVGEFGGRKMGRAMSIFMAGGEMSRTIGPILITGAIALFTLEGSFVVMTVGIVASVVLYLTLDTTVTDARRQAQTKVAIRPILRARRGPIGGLLAYSILTGIATTPFHFFLVKMLVDKGHGEWYGGFALSTLFASGVVGGLIGGSLSDRVGRRAMLFAFTVRDSAAALLLSLGREWIVVGAGHPGACRRDHDGAALGDSGGRR